MKHVSRERQLAISTWVNDQFETAEPPPLERAPLDFSDYPHWKSDPASGITGNVYLAPHTVYYNVPDNPEPEPRWWDIGELPEHLRGSGED